MHETHQLHAGKRMGTLNFSLPPAGQPATSAKGLDKGSHILKGYLEL